MTPQCRTGRPRAGEDGIRIAATDRLAYTFGSGKVTAETVVDEATECEWPSSGMRGIRKPDPAGS